MYQVIKSENIDLQASSRKEIEIELKNVIEEIKLKHADKNPSFHIIRFNIKKDNNNKIIGYELIGKITYKIDKLKNNDIKTETR